jgi:hypothetical protein
VVTCALHDALALQSQNPSAASWSIANLSNNTGRAMKAYQDKVEEYRKTWQSGGCVLCVPEGGFMLP